jgi:two-component system chemotaxis response regulator CheB
VIVLVTSLGGLSALGHVLGGLPRDLGAPVVVLQHLKADRQSYLVPLLRRTTTLEVDTAVEGVKLRAGTVYVAPPGMHLQIGRGDRCRFSSSPRVCFVRPSADVLLNSMAGSCGARVLAVVLTGTGRDGTDGAVEVRRQGGYVIAQDPASSLAGGMPSAAIAADGADSILPLDQIAPRLLTRLAEVSGKN